MARHDASHRGSALCRQNTRGPASLTTLFPRSKLPLPLPLLPPLDTPCASTKPLPTPRPAEAMYQNLRCALPEGAPESVHFCDIPEAEAAQVDGAEGLNLRPFTAFPTLARCATRLSMAPGLGCDFCHLCALPCCLLCAGGGCADPDERRAHAAGDRAGAHHSRAAQPQVRPSMHAHLRGAEGQEVEMARKGSSARRAQRTSSKLMQVSPAKQRAPACPILRPCHSSFPSNLRPTPPPPPPAA